MSAGPIHLEIRDESARRHWRAAARQSAWVAGAFVAIVGVILLVGAVREWRDNPLTPYEIDTLKKQLAAEPTSEKLKDQIRSIDKQVRETYFARRQFFLRGAWLMLGAVVVLAVSAKLAADLSKEIKLPTGPVPAGPKWTLEAKIALAGAGLVFAAFFVAMRLPAYHGITFAKLLSEEKATGSAGATVPATTQGGGANVAGAAPVSDEEMKKQWPCFRGFAAAGLAYGEYPTEWDGAAGKNVLWKVKIPTPGKSSPVVWGDRVFLASGTEAQREIHCFDATTGQLKWTTPVGGKGGGGLELNQDTGWSPSTPATDGRSVFAIFPTGDLAAIDFEGKPRWSVRVGPLKTHYGHAASLMVWQGLLFVQLDQGMEPKENLSFFHVFDCATGKPVWKAGPRPVMSSWSTPLLIQPAGGPQVVALGNPWIMGYEPRTGKELWRAKGMSGEVAPSPAFAEGTLYAAVEGSDFFRIKVDGTGDVSKTHVKKSETEVLPDIVSLLAVGEKVMLVSTGGTITVFDTRQDKTLWTHDIEAGFNASPIAVGKDRVYITDKKGVTHVIELGGEFKEIAKPAVGQEVNATPAFAGGKVYIRGQAELFCIGAPAKGGSK